MTGVEQKSPPLPSPKGKEARDDFVARCIEAVENEDTDMGHEQIVAACTDQWEDAKEEKESSLEDRLERVYDAWHQPEQSPKTIEDIQPGNAELLKVFDDHVIVHREGSFYRLSYTYSENGDVTFGEPMELEFTPVEEKAKWSTAYVNDLPDDAFLYIEPGGEPDDENKTKPRSLRHLPYKDEDGNIDLPHLRNAISRLGQGDTGEDWEGFTEDKRESLQSRAQRLLEEATEDKEFGFELRELTWSEADVTGHELVIKSQETPVWSLILGENPLKAKGSAIAGYSPLSKRSNSSVSVIDGGSCIIGSVEDTKREYELKGDKLDGRFTFHEDDTGRWTMTRKSMVRELWDGIVELFEKSDQGQLVVTKDGETGRPRWVMISSTAFYDREHQIVTRGGVDKSIDRADAAGGSYGDLTFWHTDVKLGECDFQARHGLCLIESGLFDDTPVGRRAAETLAGPVGKSWGGSIEFLPLNDPVRNLLIKGKLVDAIWDDFQIVRRSALPSDRAAANYTGVLVRKKEADMNARKRQALEQLLGPDVAATVLEGADEINEKANSPDAVFKDFSVSSRLSMIAEEIEDDDVRNRVEALSEAEDVTERLDELKDIAEGLEGLAAVAMKSVIDDLTPEETEEPEEKNTELAELTAKITSLQEELKEIKEAPRGALDQHRASEDPENILEKETGADPNEKVAAVVSEIAASGFGLER
jgi:hypothetical protein